MATEKHPTNTPLGAERYTEQLIEQSATQDAERFSNSNSPAHNQSPTKVAIVEDIYEYRAFLQALISNTAGLVCEGIYSNGEDALAGIPRQEPDIVLMDIGLPRMSGAVCTERLKRICPRVQIMMLTIFEDSDRIFEALKAGATGYLLKKTPPTQIIEAIFNLRDGGAPMSSQIARKVVEVFQPDPLLQTLTNRERELLSYLAKGYSYKEIAETVNISVKTVNKHIYNIYEKLHVNSGTEAIAKYLGKL
jgi:DNA-binding NarL/FixJ family response regulator